MKKNSKKENNDYWSAACIILLLFVTLAFAFQTMQLQPTSVINQGVSIPGARSSDCIEICENSGYSFVQVNADGCFCSGPKGVFKAK